MISYQNLAQMEVDLSKWRINDYDEIAETFDASMGDDFANIIFEPARQLIEKALGRSEKIRHLDIACGTGIFLLKLAHVMPTEPIGIDLSKGQIRQAKLRARRERVRATFQVGDIRTSPFPHDCDLVTCNMDALNHLHDLCDWNNVFSKVRRCLREGGLFLFDVNTPRRLIADFAYPGVIVKSDLTYLHFGLELERTDNAVRRKLLMQVFSQSSNSFKRTSALVEHTAVSNSVLFGMLAAAGFGKMKLRVMPRRLRAQHIFMHNRSFIVARA